MLFTYRFSIDESYCTLLLWGYNKEKHACKIIEFISVLFLLLFLKESIGQFIYNTIKSL